MESPISNPGLPATSAAPVTNTGGKNASNMFQALTAASAPLPGAGKKSTEAQERAKRRKMYIGIAVGVGVACVIALIVFRKSLFGDSTSAGEGKQSSLSLRSRPHEQERYEEAEEAGDDDEYGTSGYGNQSELSHKEYPVRL